MERKVILLTILCMLGSVSWATTTWYVNGVSGSDNNDCLSATTACRTIGHAISLALSGDSIRVAAATYTENLTIGINLNVIGASARTTIINGSRRATVVAISSSNAYATLSGMTITGGEAKFGGGIYNIGTLTINRSTVSGNTTCCAGGQGGGIYNIGTLTVNNSNISGNLAYNQCFESCHASGGGIENGGTLIINNTTISGNSALDKCNKYCVARGGGIDSYGPLFQSNNSTISGNSPSVMGCSGTYCYAYAGGLINDNYSANAIFQNSILAGNSNANCSGTITSNGYNLSSDASCHFSNTGDLNTTNAQLGPLEYNGGTTQTMAHPSGSPAIDAGNPSGCTDNLGHLLKTDQRGAPRPDKEDSGGCDMGAYESQSD